MATLQYRGYSQHRDMRLNWNWQQKRKAKQWWIRNSLHRDAQNSFKNDNPMQLQLNSVITRHFYRQRKAPYTLSVKLSDFTLWRHTWRKNWVNCAVLTGNSAGLTTVVSSRLSHTELRSSLRESHSFLSLPADTTMASSQGTSVSSISFSRWASHDIFLFKYHFLFHILRFLSFFSDNIMADVASRQQTTALFFYRPQSHAQEHTQNWQKKWQIWWKTCAVPEKIHLSFSRSCLHSQTAQFNLECMGPFTVWI